MNNPQHLYAKSIGEVQPETSAEINARLLSHLKFTYWAAEAILNVTSESTLQALGIDPSEKERFQRIVLLAAAIHDLGKANSHFQGVLTGKEDRQSVRHEWVLYLLLRRSPLGPWIRSALLNEDEDDFTYLIWAVTGHHRKNIEEATQENSGMKLFFNHPDFQEILDWIADEFKISPCFQKDDEESLKNFASEMTWEDFSETIAENGDIIKDETLPDTRNIDQDFIDDDWDFYKTSEKALMAAARSILMAADVIASAMADPQFPSISQELTKNDIGEWVQKNLKKHPTREEYQRVVAARQDLMAAQKGGKSANPELNRQRNEFQDRTANSPTRVTLITAGCGSGKTLAAFRWGVNKCSETGNRLFFCYPTTGTATEGFLDYLLDDQNHALGNLVHSRVSVDFLLHERMKNIASDGNDLREIIKSLRLWGMGLVSCTVDTVLCFLANGYSGHLAWPVFSQSLFVFDEIHSYDDKLFQYLISFLRIMRGVPILLMTASLPKQRLEQIQKVIENPGHNEPGETLTIIQGPEEWENIRRYRRLDSENDINQDSLDYLGEAAEHYERGEKVLWICNTVSRAIQIIRKLKEEYPNFNVLTYHSHFKYKDRVNRHSQCVEAFQKEEPVICVTTQVAEMSLDISADFLLTDFAPIPALIQRLGRLNRRAITHGTKFFRIIYPKNKQGEPYYAPYIKNKQELKWPQETKTWLQELGNNELSQANLTKTWEKAAPSTANEHDETIHLPVWLAPGPEMNHDNLREPGVNCDIILREDWQSVMMDGKSAYLQCVIPMTDKKDKRLKPELKYGCYIVDNGQTVHYDPEIGCEWI